MRKTLFAAATQLGFIIGVGIFSVPYVTVKAGFWVGMLWLAVLGVALTGVNIFYGRVVGAVKGRHRFPGYVAALLGERWRPLAAVLNIMSSWSAIVIYMIVGGGFVHSMIGGYLGGGVLWYVVGFWAIFALLIWFGLRMVAGVEFGMTALLVISMIIVIGFAWQRISLVNFTGVHIENLFVPYGVILFALGGAGAVPIMYDMVGHDKKKLNTAIIFGTCVATVLTAVFTIAVVGATGFGVTPEAFAGLANILGAWIIRLGMVFGVFAIATTYLVLGLNLQEVFQYDIKQGRLISWMLALMVPLGLFLIGTRDFLRVMDFSGGIILSLENVLLIVVFFALLKKRKNTFRSRAWGSIFAWGIVVVLGTGCVLKIVQLLNTFCGSWL